MENIKKDKKKLVIMTDLIAVVVIVITGIMIAWTTKGQNALSELQNNESLAVADGDGLPQMEDKFEISEDGTVYKNVTATYFTAKEVVDYTDIMEKQVLSSQMICKGDVGAMSKTTDGKEHGCRICSFCIDPLFDDTSIVKIEYLLENASGTMAEQKVDNIKTREQNVESKVYETTLDQQQNIYLVLYQPYENITDSVNVQNVIDSVEQARMKVVLTYQDDRMETRYFGFSSYRTYNYNTFYIYSLTY
jgi:hypothetical protein